MQKKGSWAGASLLAATLMLTGCGGSGGGELSVNPDDHAPPPPETGFNATYGFTGVVRDVENTVGLSGAALNFYDSLPLTEAPSTENGCPPPAVDADITTLPVLCATSGSDGNYTTAALRVEGYPIIKISLAGYAPLEYQYDEPAPLNIPGQTDPQQLEPIRLLTTAQATGTVTIEGLVTNALTGDPVPSANVELRRGMNMKVGDVLYTTTTGTDGRYSLTVDAGTYTAHITATIDGDATVPSYTTVWAAYSDVAGTYDAVNLNNSATVTPGLEAGQWRIVLSWGENPADLDSHLWAPSPGSSATDCASLEHIDWTNKTNASGTLNLDVDDTSGRGPETITIRQQVAGTYYYAIHHFAGSTSIAASSATVKVYKGNTLRGTFYAPTSGSGFIWNVFRISGDSLIPVNSYSAGDLGDTPNCP